MDIYIQIGVLFLLLIALTAFTNSFILPSNDFVKGNREITNQNVAVLSQSASSLGESYAGKTGIRGSHVKSLIEANVHKDFTFAIITKNAHNSVVFYGTREEYVGETHMVSRNVPSKMASISTSIYAKVNADLNADNINTVDPFTRDNVRHIDAVFLNSIPNRMYSALIGSYTTDNSRKTKFEMQVEGLSNYTLQTILMYPYESTTGFKVNRISKGQLTIGNNLDSSIRNTDTTYLNDKDSRYFVSDQSYFKSVDLVDKAGRVIGVLFEEHDHPYSIVGLYY